MGNWCSKEDPKVTIINQAAQSFTTPSTYGVTNNTQPIPGRNINGSSKQKRKLQLMRILQRIFLYT
jgi:hypothetical protein